MRPAEHRGRRVADRLVRLATRGYFELSYRLLLRSAAGRRMLASTAAGGEPVHGYFTHDDRATLLADLDPQPGEVLLDLGAGAGGIAIDLHRRSGVSVLGVDLSHRAVAAASHAARAAGCADAVTFVTGDLARPPVGRAAKDYAIDSLMFAPDPIQALRGIGDALGPGGLLFATLLVFRPDAETRLVRSIEAAGAVVERLEDRTPALEERSRARARGALSARGGGRLSPGDRLAVGLVTTEEAAVRRLIAQGWVSRWRIALRYGGGVGLDCGPRHIAPVARRASSSETR